MQNQMNKYRRLKNLFLRQSYLDAWEDYQRSILKKSFPKWDYIVLTASNEEQGKAFQKQIEYRSEKGVLPDATKFLVIPDPDLPCTSVELTCTVRLKRTAEVM